MNKCMKMDGGGPFRVFSGQVIDDSELAKCLMFRFSQKCGSLSCTSSGIFLTKLGLSENNEEDIENKVNMYKVA